MRKTLIVALREYIVSVRTKAFLIGLLMMPLMMGGSFIVGALMQGRVDTKDKRIAVADYTGRLFDALDSAARQRNEAAIFTGEGTARKQTLPRFVLEKVDTGGADMQRLSLQLSDRIRKGELMAFVLIGPNVIDTNKDPGQATLNYYSNTPTYNDALGWISGVLNEQIQQLRLEGAAFDPKVVRQLTQRVPVGNLGLVKMDDAGNIISAVETNQLANFLVPFAMMFLMFMVIMATTTPLLNSTLEEKTQRIAEVLLASIPPFELMVGKLTRDRGRVSDHGYRVPGRRVRSAEPRGVCPILSLAECLVVCGLPESRRIDVRVHFYSHRRRGQRHEGSSKHDDAGDAAGRLSDVCPAKRHTRTRVDSFARDVSIPACNADAHDHPANGAAGNPGLAALVGRRARAFDVPGVCVCCWKNLPRRHSDAGKRREDQRNVPMGPSRVGAWHWRRIKCQVQRTSVQGSTMACSTWAYVGFSPRLILSRRSVIGDTTCSQPLSKFQLRRARRSHESYEQARAIDRKS